ncbi:CNTN3 [Cordylochernes scorpioides]|uniref:CNTN3 n=1 Tax=Cordylochernes scorpioides TaxID=51811 RepID=A0ABY6KF54_9ARAC|nr:CNTN3 [Cordylochernes scorpioides]
MTRWRCAASRTQGSSWMLRTSGTTTNCPSTWVPTPRYSPCKLKPCCKCCEVQLLVAQGSYPGYLRIVNITQSEAGNYQCVTKTHIGRIGDKTELLVIGSTLLHSDERDNKSETLCIGFVFVALCVKLIPNSNLSILSSVCVCEQTLPPEEWNAEEIWYKVYFKPTHTKMDYHEKELKVRGNVGHFVEFVGDENYYLQYTVRVQAINRIAPGPISPPVVIYSAENLPQIQPSGVYAIPHNSTALLVSWSPLELTREKIRGELIGHRIKYWRNGKEPQADSLILLRRGAEPHSLIVGLQPNTEYFVAVMAYNSAGSGVESMPYLARTFKSAPQRAPTSVQVKALSPTSVLVSWRGVLTTSDEEPIVGYKVESQLALLMDGLT